MKTIFKRTLQACVLSAAVASPALMAATDVTSVRIDYLRAFYPLERSGIAVDLAIIGGQAFFNGDAPAFITVRVGGQSYTQPTDYHGNFSFLFYLNGAGQVYVDGWAGNPGGTPQAGKKITKVVPVRRVK